ncbi:MAG: arabinose efflux permease family protein [Mycetocola sp.]|nr:arabinose efflux permease family protein [Mycetocola sp.]
MSLIKINALSGLYSLGLGISGVMLTFVAISDGLPIGVIALLSAASAASQMISRLVLGVAFRHVADRVVMALALLVLGLSMGAVLALPGIVGLTIAQVLQGASRAGFWTGSQIHVLRLAKVPANGMARNQFVSSAIGVLGPVIAGAFAGQDPRLAAWVVLSVSLLGVVGSMLLGRLPVFDPPKKPKEGGVWKRPGVAISSMGSLASGVWYVAINTFVPVVLGAAPWSTLSIGLIMAATNASMLIGVIGAGVAKPVWYESIIIIGTITSSLGVALLCLAGILPLVTMAGLVTSGVGAGMLMTLYPTLAAQSVHPEEKAQAVVTTGVYRSSALLGTPILVSVATLFMPIGGAMLIVAGIAGAPGIVTAINRALAAAGKRRFEGPETEL